MNADLEPEHVPNLIYFDDDNVTVPAEVCEKCSDEGKGHWVPVSFCPEAMAVLESREN